MAEKERKINRKEIQRSGFDSRQGKIFLFHSVQTNSGAHPASYKMGTGGDFPRSTASGARS
jgi:hypothetical protein